MTVLGSVIRISELFTQELLGLSQPGSLKDDSKITFHSQPILNAKTAILIQCAALSTESNVSYRSAKLNKCKYIRIYAHLNYYFHLCNV